MSAVISQLDVLIEYMSSDGWPYRAAEARAELAQLKSKAAECDKWRAWKPDDETLQVLQQQARNRDGSYTNGLAACVVYIGALEAQLRAQAETSDANWRALWLHIIKRMGGEDDTPPTNDGFDYLLETMHSYAHVKAAQTVSAVELAAYRYYLGDTDDKPLCELFEDMGVDDRKRYSKASNGERAA